MRRKWYSPQDLAELWGVSRKTVLRAIRGGDLPAVRIRPQCIRVTPVDAAAYYATRASGIGDSCPPVSPVVPRGDIEPEQREA